MMGNKTTMIVVVLLVHLLRSLSVVMLSSNEQNSVMMAIQTITMAVVHNVHLRSHKHVVYQVTWYQIHDLNHISNVLQTFHTLRDMQHHGTHQVQMQIICV